MNVGEWQDAQTLREELGVRLKTLIDAYRESEPLEGYEIDSREGDDGRQWRAIPEDDEDPPIEERIYEALEERFDGDVSVDQNGNATEGLVLSVGGVTVAVSPDDAPEDDVYAVGTGFEEMPEVAADPDGVVKAILGWATDDEGADEPFYENRERADTESPRLDDSPVHGRTVNGLEDAGMATADDVLDAVSACETVDDVVSTLSEIDGVGRKGAREVADWLQELDEWSPTDASADAEEGEYPAWVEELDDDDVEPAKRAVDQARADGEVPRADDLSTEARGLLEEWLVGRNDGVATVECPHCGIAALQAPIAVDNGGERDCHGCGETWWLQIDGDGYHAFRDEPDEIVEIRCPYCDALFDAARPGEYEGGAAECTTDGDVEGVPGCPTAEPEPCGELFYLEATDDGYRTHESADAFLDSDAEPTVDDLPDALAELYDAVEAGVGPELEVLSADRGNLEVRARGVGGPAVRLSMTSDGEVWAGVDSSEAQSPTDDVSEAADGTLEAIEEAYPGLVPALDDEEETNDEGADEKPDADDEEDTVLEWPDDVGPSVPPDERPHPDLVDCRVLGHAESDTEQWDHLRSHGVGSSDVGAILGFSEHAAPEDIWKDKVEGEEPDERPWLKGYAEFGTWFERYIREWCEEQFGASIVPGEDLGTLQSGRWERAVANIDGLDVANGQPRIEEIKTTSSEWTSVPDDYRAQVQHQMFVTGLQEARVRQFVSPIRRELIPSLLDEFRDVCLVDQEADRTMADWLLEEGEMHTWIVERDEHFIKRMVERERDFWEFVEQEVPPPEADPEGTVDLSESSSVVREFEKLATVSRELEDALEQPDGQDLDDIRDRTKEATRTVIERATAFKEVPSEFDEFHEATMAYENAIEADNGDLEEKLEEVREQARRAIRRAIAIAGENPKRVRVGRHKATFVEQKHCEYWNLYPDDDGSLWPDER